MNRLPEIPPVQGVDEPIARILRPLRERSEILSGRRGKTIDKLGPTATDVDRNNKINELIDWLTQ